MKFLSKFYIGLVFLILYAPILIVILFSFNESGNLSSFSNFTLYWYQELFSDEEALVALKNSLILAVCSSLIATVLGTLAAFSISRAKNKYYRKAMESVANIPMTPGGAGGVPPGGIRGSGIHHALRQVRQ